MKYTWFSKYLRRVTAFFPNMFLYAFVYLCVIVILLVFVIWLPEIIFGYKLSQPAVIYIILSSSSIILTTWGDKVSWWLLKFITWGKISHLERHKLDKNKIRFLLIFVYFIVIIVFTISSLVSYQVFEVEKMDYSVIQSFATYLSYDRMIRNYPTILKKERSSENHDDDDHI
jgi:magnesium-transporting ATPase (P-type)